MSTSHALRARRPSVDAMRDRVVDLVRSADADVTRLGEGWYRSAHAEARRMAEATGLSLSTCAGVIAAVSPSTPWSQNVKLAYAICQGSRRGTYSANVAKAARIIAGEHWTDVLGGPKTRSFADNIERPASPDSITIDRWALRAVGWGSDSVTDAGYRQVAEAYRQAAETLGLLPNVVQAIAWVMIRGGAE